MNTTKNMNDKRNITTGFFIVYFLKLHKKYAYINHQIQNI